MPYPEPYRLNLAAQGIAKLAKVPVHYQHEFSERIIEIVMALRKRHRSPEWGKPGGLLTEAADAARRLQDTFYRMNKRDRAWVEHVKQSAQPLFAHPINDLGTTIYQIVKLLDAALGRTSPLPRHIAKMSAKLLGGKLPKIRDQMLRELVFGLLSTATSTGGKLSFDMNKESGTLAVALGILRDHLPEGLVPEPLPSRTIQRLKTEFFRLRRFAPTPMLDPQEPTAGDLRLRTASPSVKPVDAVDPDASPASRNRM
jgi:hypothetical protein